LSPGGSSTVHIYTQTIHKTTQITTNLEEWGPCPVFASFTLAFVLQLRKSTVKPQSGYEKTSRGKINLPYCYTIFKIAKETKAPVGSTRGDVNGAAEEVGVWEYYVMASGK